MRFLPAVLLAALLAALAPTLSNAEGSGAVAGDTREGVLRLLPPDSVTQHEMTIGGRKLAYMATAGTLNLFGQDGAQTAAIFYTAYVKRDGGADRPLTFFLNGGPGASSALLHLGLVRPKNMDFG